MGTGKLLSFQFTGGPTLLFSRSSGSRQLRGSRASDQNPFNQADRFARTRFVEVIAHSSKPINNTGLVCIVGRHLESDAVADGKADETFTHSARNMCKNEVLIGESNTEHRAGQHGHDCSFQFDRFFCRHKAIKKSKPALESSEPAAKDRSTGDYRKKNGYRAVFPAALRGDELR